MQLKNILLVQPVGYLESACMVKNAQLVVTDSGGLQREAFFAGKKCVTLLDFVVWPETMVGNRNVLAKPKAEDILEKIAIPQDVSTDYHPFGDGQRRRQDSAGNRNCGKIKTPAIVGGSKTVSC